MAKNIEMQVLNGSSYEAIYPVPAKHKNSHKTGEADAISPSDIGAVPTSRTVNGKALSANITLSASDVSAYSKSETNTLLANKENSFSVLPLNKGGTGANNIGTARANLGIDKHISCPAGGSIALTLPRESIFLIGTSDNIRTSGLILVYTKGSSAQNNVGRAVQLDTPLNWSYSLSGGVLTLSETDGQYPADFSVVTLCCGIYSEVYS